MALIKCSECGKEISEKAKTCIHCGNPIYKEKTKTMNKKKWEELTPDEKRKIIAYRKFNKEWFDNTRYFTLVFAIIGLIFGFFAFISDKFLLTIPMLILLSLSYFFSFKKDKEQKRWYEKNVDRLYEDEVIK